MEDRDHIAVHSQTSVSHRSGPAALYQAQPYLPRYLSRPTSGDRVVSGIANKATRRHYRLQIPGRDADFQASWLSSVGLTTTTSRAPLLYSMGYFASCGHSIGLRAWGPIAVIIQAGNDCSCTVSKDPIRPSSRSIQFMPSGV